MYAFRILSCVIDLPLQKKYILYFIKFNWRLRRFKTMFKILKLINCAEQNT